MKDLYNKTILIGREPEKGRLLIAVNTGSGTKSGAIGAPGSVSMGVSRCIPAQGKAHCKIDIDNNGNIRIANIKEENITYVNGTEVFAKTVKENCTIALGRDKYTVEMKAILDCAKKILSANNAAPQPVKQQAGQQAISETFDIDHLEKVWNEYHRKSVHLQLSQKKQNIIKGLYLPCTLVSTLIGIFAKELGLDKSISDALSYSMYGIAAFFLFYGLYKSITDKSITMKEKLNDWLMDNYVCPNPECRHFMGNQPFKVLKQNKNCPYCKCKYTVSNKS